MPKLLIAVGEHVRCCLLPQGEEGSRTDKQSYFSAKLRAYFRYKGQQGEFFDEVAASNEVYKRFVVPLTEAHFIPVLFERDVATGNVVRAIQDTSVIIDYVEALHPSPSMTPASPTLRFVSYLLEVFGDEWMKFPAMHYRWSFPQNEKYLIHEWGRLAMPNLPAAERDAAVLAMNKGPSFSNMKRTLPVLGITPDSVPGVEATFVELLELLNDHLLVHDFILGGTPSLADFAMYGPFFAHLYKDPVPSAIVRMRAPAVAEWIDRLSGVRPSTVRGKSIVPHARNNAFVDPPHVARYGRVEATGPFSEGGDALPGSLERIVEFVFREHVPLLCSTCDVAAQWLVDNPAATAMPRGIGFHDFAIGGRVASRLAFAYDVWMTQRLMEHAAPCREWIAQLPNGPRLLALDLDRTRLRLAKGAQLVVVARESKL